MVELRLLDSGKPDSSYLIQHFPCVLGRGPNADLRLEEPGVWDNHLQIELDPDGFLVAAFPEAHTCVNGEPIQRALLKNGDLIEAGGIKLQFWLAQPRQHRLWLRETATWVALVLLSIGEIGLVYALLR
jgi:pSer/pThr/pTyr-binding forkhead associated (FHA) protein